MREGREKKGTGKIEVGLGQNNHCTHKSMGSDIEHLSTSNRMQTMTHKDNNRILIMKNREVQALKNAQRKERGN